ncbi:MAG: hypothetical protein ACRDZV_05760, partial [Acidimicrobiia bacterium]
DGIPANSASASLLETYGLAINSTTGQIYISLFNQHKVLILAESAPPPSGGGAPSATIEPVSDIQADSATFNGTVNPNGAQTDYHFEYSDDDGATWTSVPIPDADAGDGSDDVAVSQPVDGLEPGTTYRVRLVATNSVDSTTSTEETFTTAGGPPIVTIAEATEVTPTGATLNGTVNPNLSPTTYHFEYSDNGGATWTSTPTRGAGGGGDDVEVSERVEGLEPETTYRVRLVATNSVDSTTSTEETFMTSSGRPIVGDVRATEVTDTRALLSALVDPEGSPTTYRFEYGTDPSYGNSTGLGTAGSGLDPVRVSNSIGGLQPNTTYHFRLGAENEVGETASADQTFTTDANPPQPSGRAYERVSPPDKNGAAIAPSEGVGVPGQASPSGDGVAYFGLTSFADNDAGAFPSTYSSTRAPTGWRTQGINAPYDPVFSIYSGFVSAVSDDHTRAIVRTTAGLTGDVPPEMEETNKLYLRHIPSDTYKLINRPPVAGGAPYRDRNHGDSVDGALADVNPSLTHVLFETQAELTPEAVPLADRDIKLYKWVDDGTAGGALTLASVLPDGQAVSGASGNNRERSSALNEDTISDDGSAVFFTSPVGTFAGGQLYRREAGTTVLVNAEESGSADFPAEGAYFEGATPDGSKVFFISPQPLVDGDTDASNDLYLYTHSADPGSEDNLTLVSGATAPTNDGRVRGAVLGMSEDGSRVYFSTVDDEIYLWDSGATTRVGGGHFGGDRGVGPVSRNAAASDVKKERTVSANGASLLVVTDSPNLLPDANHGDVDQVYLYDAVADELVCASCPLEGVPVRPATQYENPSIQGDSLNQEARGNLSAGGDRAFFQTATRLVSTDTNEDVDVYVYEAGRPRLISSGRGARPSFFVAASRSGDDVFFTTTERLVASDTDSLRDLYDARVGGGLPGPPVQEPPCAGDECQGAPSGRPALESPASVWFVGEGDAAPGLRPRFHVRRLTRRQSTRLARGRRAALRVRVNQPGKVTVRMRAKIGKRRRQVARGSRRARQAGTVRIILRLSKPARRRLARGRRLPVSVLVRFAGVREAERLTLRPRRSGRGARRSARRATVPATRDGR